MRLYLIHFITQRKYTKKCLYMYLFIYFFFLCLKQKTVECQSQIDKKKTYTDWFIGVVLRFLVPLFLFAQQC